ncbi:MAG: hypothetical protein LBD16_04715 [Oscillospiraceae bacterium]|jgi:cellobiose phosphorylase|nr:hypothetical protein [Oscillospiraceae bacterium]
MQLIENITRQYATPGSQLEAAKALWRYRLGAVQVKTPDDNINRMLNVWLPYQTTASRLWARAGFYQAGGAIGFRDQLQDMLVLLDTRPDEVREHILLCAEHQYIEGDVMHWWHPPVMSSAQTDRNSLGRGVRTRLSDDKLFMPYMTALYIAHSGDAAVLSAVRPYIKSEPLADGAEDRYEEARASGESGDLLDHCLRAIGSVRMGEHGCPLMGGGDWNDAMNKIGGDGKGESVWLGFFFVTVCRLFAAVCPKEIAVDLRARAAKVLYAIEVSAWDGEWYRRAWFDDGCVIGSSESCECRIDAIAQSWSVLAGADAKRSSMAVDSAVKRLYMPEEGIMRLLDPPFDGKLSPGYIRGYIPGVRENGGQYTHGAAWTVMALARLGETTRAWEIYQALLPQSHSYDKESAETYRVEPYVAAADVYTNPQQLGRGGWTWYTGAAAWLYHIGLRELMGFEKCGSRARLVTANANPMWERYEVVYQAGGSAYHLQARQGADEVMLDGAPVSNKDGFVELRDDGRTHLAVYPV